MEMITGCFDQMSNDKLVKYGITSSKFSVLENVDEDKFNKLKVGDKIQFILNNKTYLCEVAYKYRGSKDVKIIIEDIK